MSDVSSPFGTLEMAPCHHLTGLKNEVVPHFVFKAKLFKPQVLIEIGSKLKVFIIAGVTFDA